MLLLARILLLLTSWENRFALSKWPISNFLHQIDPDKSFFYEGDNQIKCVTCGNDTSGKPAAGVVAAGGQCNSPEMWSMLTTKKNEITLLLWIRGLEEDESFLKHEAKNLVTLSLKQNDLSGPQMSSFLT
jgi:hypothetical protein